MGARTKGARVDQARTARLAGQRELSKFTRWLVDSLAAFAKPAGSLLLSYAALFLCAWGVFREGLQEGVGSTTQWAALGGLAILLLARLFERVRPPSTDADGLPPPKRSSTILDLELGSLFVATAFVVMEMNGGPAGLLYPFVYALVAFLVAFHRVALGAYFLLLIIGSEAAITFFQPSPEGLKLFISHTSFNLLFGLLYALFLRTEIVARRHRAEREVQDYLQSIDREAKQFRLTSGGTHERSDMSADDVAARRKVGSVQAISESLYNVLAVAERALSPHTVALLWLDNSDTKVRVKELRSQSDAVTEKAIAAAEGFLGAIAKRREPLVMRDIKSGHSGLVYYNRPVPVTDFAGVPVMDGGHLRGMLIADRINQQPFNDADVAVLQTLAGEIVRAVQVERIFAEMDLEKYQKERFYEASREFNKARTVGEVAQTTLRAARRVAAVDFAVVVVATEKENRLRIAAAEGPEGVGYDTWMGRDFGADEGLIGAAIKARHPLPHGTGRVNSKVILAPGFDTPWAGAKVVPLLWQDVGVGGLVLGGHREDFLPAGVLDMLKVIADHAAIALANAQMYERMEKMATTDGLTGLTNHRHFQEMFDLMVVRAERYGRKVSVILTDIDHFKSINDTYGHPVGDRVLKRVSEILMQNARRSDIVARYGGEEFAVLMEETDRTGAKHIAERIRKAIEAEVFRSDNGPFKATVSLGIATLPEDASQKGRLIECADQALYAAKREGRNRTITFDMLHKPRKELSPQA